MKTTTMTAMTTIKATDTAAAIVVVPTLDDMTIFSLEPSPSVVVVVVGGEAASNNQRICNNISVLFR